mmetsp:Transcript_8605/g.14950  ORF Transcript_8605/g.14950 Transcript_8605/m.14950 type:complete len:508 (-) Transcript_8605:148-1671(-)|eukprot:CAMPEP_0183724650 /NCGR_PEP_ID=MMETSP0737-20130205/18063_1 /TAXON_ID=385413 /ORGANISM="Thalassiosira miniscula, Strain CCMP1093" /LENGTH=507 /DNA_ID=CAMNT_0025955291 /DNA_START=38 /DNA_END=1561 /DNA_ORIENTATION=-
MNSNPTSSLRRRGARREGSSPIPIPRNDSADESAGGVGIAAALSGDSTDMSSFMRGSSSNHSSDASTAGATAPPTPSRMRRQMSGGAVSKDESRLRKIATRIISSLIMISLFIGILLSGHVYVCALVFVLEVLLFRELVTVRYNAFFDRIDQTIPLFRTTQWMWFFVSIFYTYAEFTVEMIKSNTKLHYLLEYAQWAPMLSFTLYTGTFVLTIATMQTGHIKFQLNQLCWTIVVLCLTVGQLKYIMHNIYNGLIWFTLPILLVITNDVMAYFSGMTCGKKFIHRKFVELSPNKTWEGFIGGGIFTVIIGWYLSRYLAKFTWMTCPTNQVTFFPQKLECEVENIFHEATTYLPEQAFELLPHALNRLWSNVVEICSIDGDTTDLTACISGASNQKHHHWEMALSIVPIQLHAISLSLFASLVAPFGGFLASAIKRAYGIKDFDSIIPGHGGLMDRFDCQLIMALATWVHYNTFVKITTVSVSKLLYMYKLLGEEEQRQFLEKITRIQN